MNITYPTRVIWTYIVFQDVKPVIGTYIDPRGYRWYINSVIPEPGIVLREPCYTPWQIELTPEHPSYLLVPGDKLQRFFRSDEIAVRREKLTSVLANESGFKYVGVSRDNLTLEANFNIELSQTRFIEIEEMDIDGMSVMVLIPYHKDGGKD
jgi:hypothetical protein